MRSKVILQCSGNGTRITQGNAANLTHLINFETNTASDAEIRDCLIDANRAQNTSGSSLILLGGGGSRNRAIHNWLQNAPGHGVFITAGANHIVSDNFFSAITDRGIAVTYAAATSGMNKIARNNITTYGGFGIGIILANDNNIEGNSVTGVARNGTVDTNGTAVTWVSGNDFTGVVKGMHATIAGTTYTVASVESTIALTLSADAGVQAGAASSIGSLEAINLDASANNVVNDNTVTTSTDSGIVLHATTAGQATYGNRILGNKAVGHTAVGISLEASGGTVSDNLIANNTVIDNATSAAAASQFDVGIRVAASAAVRNYVVDNVIRDTRGGSATHQYGVALDSVGDGNVASFNQTSGSLNAGVRGSSSDNTIAATLGTEQAPALTAGNWTVGAGWESPIVGPGLIKNADGTGTQTPSAATTIVAGTTYKVVITLSALSVGSATYTLGGVTGTSLAAATTYTDYITASTTGKLIITPTNTSRFTISAISIKALTDATGDLTVDGNLKVGSPIQSTTGNNAITIAPGGTMKTQSIDIAYGTKVLQFGSGPYLDWVDSTHIRSAGNLYFRAGYHVKASSTSIFGFSAADTTTMDSALSRIGAGIIGFGTGAAGDVAGSAQAAKFLTGTNCASVASPAACGSAAAGAFVIAATATTVTVNTTAVTANSRIFIEEDQSLGTELGVTCNTGFLAAPPVIGAKTAATSFRVDISAGLAVNPVCFTYFIVN